MSGAPADWQRQLDAAMARHRAGDFAAAIPLYQAAATARPDNADIIHLLGMALEQAGHPGQGKAAIDLAIRMAPQVAAYHNSLGNADRALGDLAGARQAFARAIALDPGYAEAHNNLGLLLQDTDAAAAEQHFRAALAAEPNYGDAAFNLAVLLWRSGQRNAALDAWRKLLAGAPDYGARIAKLARLEIAAKDADATVTLLDLLAPVSLAPGEGPMLQGGLAALRGDGDAAERHYRAALAEAPDHRDTLRLLSFRLIENGDFEAAVPLLERAHAIDTTDFPVFSALGMALSRTGAHQRAVPILQQVVAHEPASLGPWADLSVSLAKLHMYAEAAEACRKLIALDPGMAANHANLASHEARLGNLAAAEAACAEALRLDPGNTAALGNLANLRDLQGRFAEAEALYHQMLARDPEDASSHNNLGLLLLRQKRYAEAWPHYDWRARSKEWSSPDGSRGLPRWDDAAPPPGRLLLWREQGIGDEILCASLLPEFSARMSGVVQATDPRLVPLFARSFPGITVVPDDASLDPAALGLGCQRPLGDLPMLCRPTAAAFARHPRAYLKADATRAASLRARYAGAGTGPLIGVSWNSGNPRVGRSKSVSLAEMAPLLDHPAARYVSLQYGPAAADAGSLQAAGGPAVYHDADIDPLRDIDAQAAQIAAMDLVVTVSTAAAHLAAGLGKPTLILLREEWGLLWYWGNDGETTPWYPSVRLCRASRGATIADIIGRARPMLAALLAEAGF